MSIIELNISKARSKKLLGVNHLLGYPWRSVLTPWSMYSFMGVKGVST
jgi:hypothetical protein